MKSKKLRKNETINSGLNERDISNKHKNQEEVLQIMYKWFIIKKEKRIIKED